MKIYAENNENIKRSIDKRVDPAGGWLDGSTWNDSFTGDRPNLGKTPDTHQICTKFHI